MFTTALIFICIAISLYFHYTGKSQKAKTTTRCGLNATENGIFLDVCAMSTGLAELCQCTCEKNIVSLYFALKNQLWVCPPVIIPLKGYIITRRPATQATLNSTPTSGRYKRE